jgi:AcrR family transcriptional regulator
MAQKIRLRGKKREKAAQLVSDGKHTIPEMAAGVGVSERTLYRWIADPLFAARVDQITAEFRAHVLNGRLSSKSKQLAKLQDLSDRIDRVMDARALDPRHRSLPGGDTGLVMIENIKQVKEQRIKCDEHGEPILRRNPLTGMPLDPPQVELETVIRNIPFVVTDIGIVQAQQRIIEQMRDVLGQSVQRREFSFRTIEDLTPEQVFALEQYLLGGTDGHGKLLEG